MCEEAMKELLHQALYEMECYLEARGPYEREGRLKNAMNFITALIKIEKALNDRDAMEVEA